MSVGWFWEFPRQVDMHALWQFKLGAVLQDYLTYLKTPAWKLQVYTKTLLSLVRFV